MKSEKIYDAVTEIREDIIIRAGRHVFKKQAARRWIMTAVAAVLVVALVSGIMLSPASNPSVTSVYAIEEAEYPELAPYPSGEFNEDEYDAWRESIGAQRRPEGYADGLETFFVSGTRQFLSGGKGENRVCSPLSVYMALSMLAELTDGNSRQQILDLLCSESIDALRMQASDVWNANYRNDGATASVLANSVWLNEDIEYVPSTMKTLADSYYASSFRGKMGSDEFNGALNGWLNEQTGGLLEDQISGMELDPDTVLALASTIYYRAKWSDEFSPDDTRSGTFHAYSGDVECDYMYQNIVSDYYWGDKFSAVGQNLEFGKMLYLLPDEGVSVEDLISDEQTMHFVLNTAEWENRRDYQSVNLTVPKFDVTSQLDLKQGLQALGVTDIFDAQISDFYPMTAQVEDIFLSQAKHDARVMIDEEGCTAAVYTVMVMEGTGGPPEEIVDFEIDRPFIFAIISADGLPLFVGVVNQPK